MAENKPVTIMADASSTRSGGGKEESGGTITRQMRRPGVSGDWDREAFTMDPALSHAVQGSVRASEQDLIYRGKRLVNWGSKLHTAILIWKLENKEVKNNMWHLRYPLADGARNGPKVKIT